MAISQGQKFIDSIAPIIQKYAKQYGYKIASPIIAQACCESGYGTSYKAKFNNFFGLKYRKNRCPSASGTFVDGSKEQNKDGSYRDITDQWFSFKTMDDGVKGYFDFISIPNYNPVRNNITDPIEYIKVLGQCKYYTSLSYPNTIKRIIDEYNLTKYDNFGGEPKQVFNESILEPKQEVKETKTDKLAIGDTVKLLTDVYYNNKKIPQWVQQSTLYYRGDSLQGHKFSTKKTGPVTGVVKKGMLSKV